MQRCSHNCQAGAVDLINDLLVLLDKLHNFMLFVSRSMCLDAVWLPLGRNSVYMVNAWECRAHLGCRWQSPMPAWSRPRLRPARLPPDHLIIRWIISRCLLLRYEQRRPPLRATHLAERSPAAPSGSCDGGGWRRACRLHTHKNKIHQIVREEVNRKICPSESPWRIPVRPLSPLFVPLMVYVYPHRWHP